MSDVLSDFVGTKSKKRGCPTCNGIDPKTCMRCYGKTRLCDWIWDATGYHLILKASTAKTTILRKES